MPFQPLIFNGFVIGSSSGGGGGTTIGGPVSGGTPNSVLFVGAGSVLAQDNTNLNFNQSTHALTIGGIISASNFSGSSSGSNTGDVTLGTANGLSIVGQVLSLQLASSSLTGALSSADWNTFNNKQPAFISQSQNLFFASPNGSSGVPTFRSIVAADLPSLSAIYVPQSEVGVANGVASLDGAGKIPVGQLPSAVMEYQGAWNPNTNSPALSDGTGTNGFVYYVTAQRSAAVSGLTDPSMVNFQIGDLVIYSSAIGKWQLTTPAAGVQSVNGFQGVVVLTQGNLTDAGTDGITITNGTNAVWGSGTSISQHVADASHNGYLASADWNTFNNKQPAGSYITALTGDVTASGPGSATATLTNSSVTGQALTGFVVGSNSAIVATDTILGAFEKVQGQFNAGSGIYANVTLSNLTSPTAINQHLLPGSTANFNIGSNAFQWEAGFFASTVSTSGGAFSLNNQWLFEPFGIKTAPDGSQWAGLYNNNGPNQAGQEDWVIATLSGSNASHNTGNIHFETGNNSTALGPTGNIQLRTGTPGAGGVQGKIQFQDGSQGTVGQVWTSTDASGSGHWAATSSGTVTSVGLVDGSTTPIYTISNSPVTSSGNLTFTFINQSANTVLAGPTTGSAAQPTFRALVSADIPNNAANTTGTASNITATSNSTLTTLSALSLPASQLTGTTLPSSIVSSSLTSLGAQSQALNMNSHLINNVTNPVSAQDAATKNYVDNAVQGLNPALAVQAATTSASNTSSFTYSNGVGGIGATFTGPTNTALTVDGYTFTALGQRLLVKNDTQSPSGAFNGIYYVTQLQTALLPLILTRALDYDQPSDINNTGAIPVINGTVNGTTQWVETALVNTVGTDPLVFALFSNNPANYLLKANNLSDVSSASTSFNNINPMTTTGDIIYESAPGVAARLPIGTSGQVLTVSSGIPAWQPAPGTVSAFFASSQVTTASSNVSSGSFTTFSNSPAFTFTPSVTGTYKIYSPASFEANAAGIIAVARVFNTSGSATLLNENQGIVVNNGAVEVNTTYIESIYTLTSGISYQFDIQGQTNSGGVLLRGDLAPFYMFAELEVAGTSPASPRSEIWMNTGNGWGSTNTFVRYFTNTAKNIGSAISVTSNATNGTFFTINTAGIYSITYHGDASNQITQFFIALNPASLTSSPLSTGSVISSGEAPAGAIGGSASITLNLSPGDLIYPMTQLNTYTGLSTTMDVGIRITQVGN